MLAEDYISPAIPTVHLYDSAETTMFWMNLLNVHHLSVVDNGRYLGVVDYDALANEDYLTISNVLAHKPQTAGYWVFHNQHYLDALKLMLETKLTVVPVLNSEQQFVGNIGQREMLKGFGSVTAVNEPGDAIVLRIPINDYSLQEIASIIESNNTRIINIFTTPIPESYMMYVTIKLSKSEIAPIVMSFERYGYEVAYTFSDSKFAEDTRDHYDALMRFLDI